MTLIRSRAPGKLFLIGEYAVLDGAPALLTAVDRFVDVSVRESPDARWRVSMPGTGVDPVVLESDGSRPAGLGVAAHKALRVFDAVRDEVFAVSAHAPEPLEIIIDSSPFQRAGAKLGLGSSAAVAVALTDALGTACGLRLGTEQVRTIADAAHRLSQGGIGSGGDVAASSYGGLIEFVPGAVPVSLTWPDGLEMMVVATGAGADTTDLVGRVRGFRSADSAGYRRLIGRLASLAGEVRASLADADQFLGLCSDYFETLTELDASARAGIVTDRHRELHAVATSAGGVFKTSGAGGGDVGLAFSRSGEPATRLAAALESAGADIIPMSGGAPGVHPGGANV